MGGGVNKGQENKGPTNSNQVQCQHVDDDIGWARLVQLQTEASLSVTAKF